MIKIYRNKDNAKRFKISKDIKEKIENFVPNDNSTIKIKVQSNRIIASEDDIYLISKKKNYKAYNKVNVGDYVYNKYEDIDYYCVYKSKNYIILKTL